MLEWMRAHWHITCHVDKSHYNLSFVFTASCIFTPERSTLSLSHTHLCKSDITRWAFLFPTDCVILNTLNSLNLPCTFTHIPPLPLLILLRYVTTLSLSGKSIWMTPRQVYLFLIYYNDNIPFTHFSMATSNTCINLGTKVQIAQFYWICCQYRILLGKTYKHLFVEYQYIN